MLKVHQLFREVMRNAAILIGGRATNAMLGLAGYAIASRSLGLAGFGLLIVINAFAEAVGDVVKFQSWQTVLNYGAKPLGEGGSHDFQRVLRFSFLLDLISAVTGIAVGCAGVWVVGPWLSLPQELRPAAMLYATSIGFLVSATPSGVLRLYGRFGLLASQINLQSAVWVVGGLIAVAMRAGLAGFLVVWWAGTLAPFLFLFGAAWRELHKRGAMVGFNWRAGHLTRGFPGIWRFALTTNANATIELAFNHFATLIVGGLLDPAQAALWRVAKQIADAVAAPASMVVSALYPEFAKLVAAGDHHTVGRLGLKVIAWIGGTATLLLVVCAFIGGPALALAMGKGFIAAGPVLTWLVGAAVIGVWSAPLEPILVSTGRPGVVFRSKGLAALIYLMLLAPILRTYGLVGGGAATVVAQLAMGAGMLLGVLNWYRDPSSGVGAAQSKPETAA